MSIDLGQMQQEQGRQTLNMTLKKGLKMTLKKGGNKLHNINLLSGWDDTQLKEDMDLDFLLMLYCNDEVTGVEGQVVYFDNLKEKGVLYTKDKKKGAASGDVEKVIINLDEVEKSVNRIRIINYIYEAEERNQNFGQARNAYISIVNADESFEEARFSLSGDFSLYSGVKIGDLIRKDDYWEFVAINEGVTGNHIEIANANMEA